MPFFTCFEISSFIFFYKLKFKKYSYRNEMRLAEKDRRNAMKILWQQVALVLDRFFFFVFFFATAFTSLSIIYQDQLN